MRRFEPRSEVPLSPGQGSASFRYDTALTALNAAEPDIPVQVTATRLEDELCFAVFYTAFVVLHRVYRAARHRTHSCLVPLASFCVAVLEACCVQNPSIKFQGNCRSPSWRALDVFKPESRVVPAK